MWLRVIVIAVVSYLLGNLNGSVVMSHFIAHEDVRSHGSGNAGLTNYIRNYGAINALGVVLMDVGKAVVACLIGRFLLPDYALEGMAIGAAGVSLGHDFPAFLNFRGGKGILCGATVAAMLDWRCFVMLLAVFAIVLLLSGYVSLGSVLAAASICVYAVIMFRSHPVVMVIVVFLGLLAIYMHRGNIQRLCSGTEPKTNLFKKKP